MISEPLKTSLSLRSIESKQNPNFKLWESLLETRGIRKAKQFISSGRKTVPELLRQSPTPVKTLLIEDQEQLIELSLPPSVDCFLLTPALFKALDIFGTNFPLAVGEVPEIAQADLTQPPQGLELMCALSDPNNMGALIRSAAAFCVSRVILMTEAAHPFHPRALRAGANGQFHLQFLRGPNWSELNAAAGPCLALDNTGEPMANFPWPRDVRLVLGEEGRGLPENLNLKRLVIPISSQIDSLNATVAASIALFAHRQSQR